MIKVVTDASVDMPDGWREKYQIEVLPLNIQFGNETISSDQIHGPEEFYQMVNERRIAPRTSLPSPGQVIEFYRKIAHPGDVILSLHIARKMSGTFETVQFCIKELASEYQIFPFDSGAGSAALGFMCREARRMADLQMSPAAILARLENLKTKLTLVFTLDTLEYAHLSGRISRLQAAVTSLLRIKPIIILKDGLLQMAEKVRTRQASLQRMIEVARDYAKNNLVDIAIVHANDLKTALYVKSAILQQFNVRDLVFTDLSIPVAANLGPGTIGIVAIPVMNLEGK